MLFMKHKIQILGGNREFHLNPIIRFNPVFRSIGNTVSSKFSIRPSLTCEVPLAVLARHQPLDARVEHVVLHHEARDLGGAGVGARHGVLLARVEVRLQLVQRARPRAALVLQIKDESH